MNLSPKRIARIIAWVNLPLVLIAFFGCLLIIIIGGDMHTSTGQVKDFADLFFIGMCIGFAGVGVGILYFVAAYKRNVTKGLSLLCWIASIIMNLFCIGVLYFSGIQILTGFLNYEKNIAYIIFIYPISILILSIIALIKTNRSTLEVQA
jgi:hypothetical protein